MTKASSGLAFATEAPQPLGVGAHFRRQDFYRDAIAQQDVPCQVNRTHPAFAKQRFNLILAIEDGANERGRIVFKYLAVGGTEADIILVFCFADSAVFHAELVPKCRSLTYRLRGELLGGAEVLIDRT